MILYDDALERSRRLAWAKFFRAREDAEAAVLWAAEMGAWLTALVEELPDPAVQLLAILAEAISPSDALTVRNYVTAHLSASAA